MAVQFPARLSAARRQVLIDMAKVSQISYNSPDVVSQRWKARNKSVEKPYDVFRRVLSEPLYISCEPCDAQCYIMKYEPVADENDTLGAKPVLVMSVRGTSSVLDWMCDCEVEQTVFKDCTGKYYKGALVHDGFNKQFKALANTFDSQIKQHLSAGNHLLCTGHSLGSLSAIAATHYALGFPKQVWHVSFGSPRIGNAAFAKLYNDNVQYKHRTVNSHDPVSKVPPPLKYQHVDSELHTGAQDKYKDIAIILDVGDHDISKYIDNLETPNVKQESKSPEVKSYLLELLCMF